MRIDTKWRNPWSIRPKDMIFMCEQMEAFYEEVDDLFTTLIRVWPFHPYVTGYEFRTVFLAEINDGAPDDPTKQ